MTEIVNETLYDAQHKVWTHGVSNMATLQRAAYRQPAQHSTTLVSMKQSEPVVHCSHTTMVNPKELKPHPRNPNKHPDAQIKRLAEIIQHQGWRAPIKVSKQSGMVTCGHGRLLAALHAGWTQVPVDYQDYASEAVEYEDLVADNAIQSWSELDLSAIRAEIANIDGIEEIMLGLPDVVETTGELPELSSDEPACRQVTFILSQAQWDTLQQALSMASEQFACVDEMNQNKNGNTLAEILQWYVCSKKC